MTAAAPLLPAPTVEQFVDLERRAIAAAEALRMLDTTLARDAETVKGGTFDAQNTDVERREEEVRGELQLLAEALQAAGRSKDASASRALIFDVRAAVEGFADVDALRDGERWCRGLRGETGGDHG